jgi:hypothetical protein
MTKNNIIKNLPPYLTEKEKAEMEDKEQEIRDTAFGLANIIESFYEEYNLNTYKEIIQYFQDKEKEIK